MQGSGFHQFVESAFPEKKKKQRLFPIELPQRVYPRRNDRSSNELSKQIEISKLEEISPQNSKESQINGSQLSTLEQQQKELGLRFQLQVAQNMVRLRSLPDDHINSTSFQSSSRTVADHSRGSNEEEEKAPNNLPASPQLEISGHIDHSYEAFSLGTEFRGLINLSQDHRERVATDDNHFKPHKIYQQDSGKLSSGRILKETGRFKQSPSKRADCLADEAQIKEEAALELCSGETSKRNLAHHPPTKPPPLLHKKAKQSLQEGGGNRANLSVQQGYQKESISEMHPTHIRLADLQVLYEANAPEDKTPKEGNAPLKVDSDPSKQQTINTWEFSLYPTMKRESANKDRPTSSKPSPEGALHPGPKSQSPGAPTQNKQETSSKCVADDLQVSASQSQDFAFDFKSSSRRKLPIQQKLSESKATTQRVNTARDRTDQDTGELQMIDFQFTTARAKQSKLSVGSLAASPRESKERKEEPAASSNVNQNIIPRAPRQRNPERALQTGSGPRTLDLRPPNAFITSNRSGPDHKPSRLGLNNLNVALSEQKLKPMNQVQAAVNLDSLALIKKQREEQPVAVGYGHLPVFPSRQTAQQPVAPSKDTTQSATMSVLSEDELPRTLLYKERMQQRNLKYGLKKTAMVRSNNLIDMSKPIRLMNRMSTIKEGGPCKAKTIPNCQSGPMLIQDKHKKGVYRLVQANPPEPRRQGSNSVFRNTTTRAPSGMAESSSKRFDSLSRPSTKEGRATMPAQAAKPYRSQRENKKGSLRESRSIYSRQSKVIGPISESLQIQQPGSQYVSKPRDGKGSQNFGEALLIHQPGVMQTQPMHSLTSTKVRLKRPTPGGIGGITTCKEFQTAEGGRPTRSRIAMKRSSGPREASLVSSQPSYYLQSQPHERTNSNFNSLLQLDGSSQQHFQQPLKYEPLISQISLQSNQLGLVALPTGHEETQVNKSNLYAQVLTSSNNDDSPQKQWAQNPQEIPPLIEPRALMRGSSKPAQKLRISRNKLASYFGTHHHQQLPPTFE